MGRKAHLKEDVWKFIKKSGIDDCWEWQLKKNRLGYGEFSIKHKSYRAHRLVFELSNPGVRLKKSMKATANSQLVLHSCDNPSCCNPSHLFLGTPKDNTQDMIRKGRRLDNRGEKHPFAKLTNEQVKKIRALLNAGTMLIRDIAVMYQISQTSVSTIKSGKTYGSVR